MTKKQKKMLYRIIITFILFSILMVTEHLGMLEKFNTIALFIIYLIPYLVIGYDIVWKAARNIKNGQIFDENFLMMIATFGAFGVQEYSEAVAVMLFYQVGELFQGYAPVYFSHDGYLPGICKCGRRWESCSGRPG